MSKPNVAFLLICVILCGCSSSSNPSPSRAKGEYIIRRHDESLLKIEPMISVKRALYPWEEEQRSSYPKITKDFFRCKGSSLNPPLILTNKEKEILRHYDCGGPQKHSLPLRDQKEFIYPILIDLLNYIQISTGKRVVITCGHCCPEHNKYLNSASSNQFSKHMMGAEVDFYVEGMEESPELVIALIFKYYEDQQKYRGLKEYLEFKGYEKEDAQGPALSWLNKEVFVKIIRKNEGRDFDNRHPYPYISIQVRHDWDLNERVIYSWEKVFHNYHRW